MDNSEAIVTSPAADTSISAEEKQWAMFAHLSAVLFGVIGPLVVWMMKKDTMPFVNEQGKEALNFQITIFLAAILCSLLMIIVIGMFLLPVLCIANLVLVIIGGIKANSGVHYRYPVALRLIK